MSVHRTVSTRELNRATLARQLLLGRVELDPVTAVRRLLALQAQEPASPYIALWTRLEAFDPTTLDEAFATRTVVKATLMRMTLHAIAAEDYPTFWAAHADHLRRARTRTVRFDAAGISPERLREIIEFALAFAAEPRSNADLTAHLSDVAGPLGDQGWWWAVRGCAPFLHVPSATPWSFGWRPSYTAARAVIPWTEPPPEKGLDRLVGRYLVAFGPATVGDIAQFTKLDRSRVRASIERLLPTLELLRGPHGEDLYDDVDAPIPEADTPAPVRFLPMWDSVLLAYQDRSRVIPPEVRKLVIRSNGDVLPTFLVDGRVAGIWRAELLHDRTVIRWRPFERLRPGIEDELEAEGAGLATFVQPREPEVYRRYARWWKAL